jgi:hypothetical protein
MPKTKILVFRKPRNMPILPDSCSEPFFWAPGAAPVPIQHEAKRSLFAINLKNPPSSFDGGESHFHFQRIKLKFALPDLR